MNKTLFTIVVILFITSTTALSQIRSVPSPAYPTIQAGIDAAVDGDTVIISPGTYEGDGNRDIDFKGKKITVRSTDPNDPNTVADTIIDCDGTETEPHRGFYFHSGESTNSVLSGLTITNGFARYGGGIYCDNSSPVIANCTITQNTASESGRQGMGGGIYCKNGNPVISNCTITNNLASHSGGGIYCEDSSSTITGCTVTANSAYSAEYYDCMGGGIVLYNGGSTIITDSSITGNSTKPLEGGGSCDRSMGGGIYLGSGNLTVANSTISSNMTNIGGGIYSQGKLDVNNCTIRDNIAEVSCESSGGGIYCWNSLKVTNSIISNNSASGGVFVGGGICCSWGSLEVTDSIISNNSVTGRGLHAGGGGIFCWDSLKVTNSTISNNSISGGDFVSGGICCWGGSEVTNSTISNNSASGYDIGGGIYCLDSLKVTNSIISNNSASRVETLLYDDVGGGIYCRGSLEVTNSTITNNNTAENPYRQILPNSHPYFYGNGGIYCIGEMPIIIKNCIIWGNFPNQFPSEFHPPLPANAVTYCDVQDGWPGIGNINTDPLLEWNGHLRAGSPCINAGDTNYTPLPAETDVDGESRVMGARIDIGADELLDSDSDGLADWWEVKYFGNPTIANPSDDPDGDDWTNLDEYANVTLPNTKPVNYYVAPQDGNNTCDGLAPQWDGRHGPKKTIQAAVNACEAARNDIVTCAQGTYTGDGNRDIDFHGKTITVRSTNPKDPNVVAATIIDCNGSPSAPHRAFYLHSGEGPASAISGLTITNGIWTDEHPGEFPGPIGGGILCYFSAPAISDCVIRNCLAFNGGGIYCAGNPKITNCSISNCAASRYGGGGGICIFPAGRPTLTDCIIFNNTALMGGGMCCGGSSSPTITGCAIYNNFSISSGGGLYCVSKFYCMISSSLTITNCAIFNNAGGRGGGIKCYNCDLKLTNCNITGNSARIYAGGAISSNGSNVAIANCTLAENSAPNGNALACVSSWFSNELYPTTVQIINSILWNGGSEILKDNGSTINVTYSDIQDPWLGTGNINTDPCFVQPGYWDPNGTPADSNDDFWVEGDYHLLAGSPCINTGDPNYTPEPKETDLDGRPRIIAGRVDMGAYEFNHIPVADAGPDQTLSAGRNCIAEVTLNGSASYDEDDDQLTFLWTWEIDDQTYEANGVSPIIELPLGQHTIQLLVSDGIDDSEPNEVVITVLDTTPPEFTLSVTPTTLWPPNRQMIKVAPTWTLADNCDPSPEVSLANITCNEKIVKGNGITTGDIQVRNDGSIYLKAERNGSSSSRIYTITYQAVDVSGNTATSSATVTVPHDQSRLK